MRGPIVERRRGTAAELHSVVAGAPDRPTVVVMEVVAPALVLGSTQDPAVVDRARAAREGVEVARRRSGGGAVLVDPDAVLWIDVVVPRGHRWWRDDVSASFAPVGGAWAEVLSARLGPGSVRVQAAMARTRWSDLVCFAGRGPGEVLVEEAKVVGISQRRTRDTARFQCALLRHWDAEGTARLLRPVPDLADLGLVAAGVGRVVSEIEVVDALVAALT